MTNPQIEQALQKADEFLAAYPTLCQYDRLRDIEKKTGYSKVYWALGAVALILTFILSAGGTKLMSDIFGFAYPAYMSFKAIDSSDPIDDTQWLTYWVVFSLFSISENLFSFLVSWIPFYYIIKCGFFLWLYHPKFMGAGLVYNKVVKPYAMPYLNALGEQPKPQKKEE